MQNTYLAIIFILCLRLLTAQNTTTVYSDTTIVETTDTYDEIVYEQRKFNDNLKDKYSGKDFNYIDNLKEEHTKPKEQPQERVDFSGTLSTIGEILPYLLGLIVVFIIVRSFIDIDSNFWSFKKQKANSIDILVENEEDIADNDFKQLLARAIKNKNYRLSTRYYYLLLLQKLAENNDIKYHINKTNADYALELEDVEKRKQFSFLSYIYNYVWYGEFPVDEDKFETIKNNYNTFINSI